FDSYIVKLDNNGTILWTKTFGGFGDEYGESIVQTSDGGYAVGGYTNSYGAGDYDDYIAKLDAAGAIQWFKTYGTAGYDYALSIKQTTDGGYVLFGSTSSFGAGNNDYYVVKVDSAGLLQWSKTIGGPGGDYGFCVIQTSDGGYALSGTTLSFGAGNYDLYVVKLNATGSLEWSRTIGGTGFEYGYQIIQTSEGGYAIAASIESFGAGGYDAYIVKLNSSGQIEWNRTLGGMYDDNILSITQTTDGGYAATGFTTIAGSGADIYLIKLDSLGNTCGNSLLPDPATGSAGTSNSAPTLTSSPVPTVNSPVSLQSSNGVLVTNCITGIQPISTAIPREFSLLQNYPNPFNPTTKIRFALPSSPKEEGLGVRVVVCDIIGREVATLVNQQLQPGTYEIEWDASAFKSSIYFCLIEAGDYKASKKMVLIK
ncbi:MAG TPA: T9SS type A sorting domain-containing protein, partial [Ignavibacteria bacterium]